MNSRTINAKSNPKINRRPTRFFTPTIATFVISRNSVPFFEISANCYKLIYNSVTYLQIKMKYFWHTSSVFVLHLAMVPSNYSMSDHNPWQSIVLLRRFFYVGLLSMHSRPLLNLLVMYGF